MSKNRSNSKFLGIFLIVSSLTCLGIWFRYEFSPFSLKAQKQVALPTENISKSPLQKLWEADIEKMVSDGFFDNGITSLYKVRVFLLDQNLHTHFKNLRAPFKFSSKGLNLLEVSFMSHYSELEKKDKLIIQYNLISRKGGDMFWEHSRTISLSEDFLKK